MERLPKVSEKHGPSPAETHYDGESTADFVHGLTDDLTRLRKQELTARAREGRETKFGTLMSELNEIEADEQMIGRQEEKAAAHSGAMESHAMIDVLTELPNRRAFENSLHTEIGYLNRLEGNDVHHAHALVIDLDYFKQINDTLGHDIGDLYLKTAAAHMKKVLRRDTDVLARIGGDEFAAILFEDDDASAQKIAEKLSEAVREASAVAKEEVRKRGTPLSPNQGTISASIGLASFKKGESPEELLKRADTAMYAAKDAGKDRVVVAE